jgi:hypothetical protein
MAADQIVALILTLCVCVCVGEGLGVGVGVVAGASRWSRAHLSRQ